MAGEHLVDDVVVGPEGPVPTREVVEDGLRGGEVHADAVVARPDRHGRPDVGPVEPEQVVAERGNALSEVERPAAAAALVVDSRTGVALAVAVIPAVSVPLAPRRGGRVVIVVVGGICAAAILLGSVLALSPVAAVSGLFALCVLIAGLGGRRRVATLALNLALPLVSVGFSYAGPSTAAPLAVLFVAGAVWAWLVSLAWPTHSRAAAPGEGAMGTPAAPGWAYGVQLGLAGATCAGIGFALHFDHVGWATAAAMLVTRPSAALFARRVLGRPISVLVGAVVAIALLETSPAAPVTAVVLVAVVAAAAAAARSAWYVTPAFTTFLVFLLLGGADPGQAEAHFGERIGETLLGVTIAVAFGLLVHCAVDRRTAPGSRSQRTVDPRTISAEPDEARRRGLGDGHQ